MLAGKYDSNGFELDALESQKLTPVDGVGAATPPAAPAGGERVQELRVSLSSEAIRHLRYSMGWSRAEMARCLECELQVVLDWESGRQAPDERHRNQLLHFQHQAEMNADRVQRCPVAEVLMHDRNLSQIHDLDVVACLAAGELGGLGFKN